MKKELICAEPIRAALEDLDSRLEAAQLARDEQVGLVLSDVHKVLSKALQDAANPDFSDGLQVEDYAKLHDISPDGVYKRIKRKRLAAEKNKHGRWVITETAA